MNIAFISRSTLRDVPGGDTVQVLETVRYLRQAGVSASVYLTNAEIDYSHYDILHFFNITRPSDILYHINRSEKPFVLSPILIDYGEYDRHHRKGVSGMVLQQFSSGTNEYIKTVSRWVRQTDSLRTKSYLWKGQRHSIRSILKRAALLLPNSEKEYQQLRELYSIDTPYAVIPNGINPELFRFEPNAIKDETLVLCAARIEGIKNQMSLIRAMNDSRFKLMLIGAAAPNQKRYYAACRRIAGDNIEFRDHMPQEELRQYYNSAKVHALPSWFETCGLSSLEAGAMGCNLVITDKGYTREYFADQATYCDPGSPASILEAVEVASRRSPDGELRSRILANFTWERASALTLDAYHKILST